MIKILCVACALLFVSNAALAAEGNSEVHIPQGTYKPFFQDPGEQDISIGPLWVDAYPVTNREFSDFLRKNPQWSKKNIPEIFSSPSYLKEWSAQGKYPDKIANQPVVNVTWFAARKYCESKKKRLLTVAEWEFVSDAQNPKNLALILEWYGKPNALYSVDKASVNAFGLYGMHGLIWEWVEDFSSVIIVGDSRNSNDTSKELFCGSGSLKARDATQYATFMRFAYRSSLKANYSSPILGFRCARGQVSE